MNDYDFQPPSEPSASGTIFVLDDDESDRRLLARRLQETGVSGRTRFFAAGEEMLDVLLDVLRGAPAPIVCFVDVKMAGMSGLDVLRWIRAQRALDSIPVVMLSSSDEPQHLAEAHQFGAQCYAVKFPGPDQLRQILAAARAYSAAAGCNTSFALNCNLLVVAHAM